MTDRELFDTYKMDVYRTCVYMLKNQQDAEDVCHEVFIKILQKEFNSIESLKPWILSITMNECRNFLKKKSRVVLFNDLSTWFRNMASSEKVESHIVGNETKVELINYISKLRPKFHEVIVLKYTHLLRNDEIAEILKIPVGTVKSRLNKGIRMLKSMIGEEEKNYLLSQGVAE